MIHEFMPNHPGPRAVLDSAFEAHDIELINKNTYGR